MAELQYRGVIWSQINAKDWTVLAFLKSDQGGLGLDVAQDTDTKNAIQLALHCLLDEPVNRLKGKRLDKDDFHTLLTGGDPVRDLLQWLDLEPHAHERCEGFSKGMRQKVALAGALVHEPRLIILDEPLTGLDAGAARLVKNVLRERVRQGCTVIMTTHILEVAERMADRIGVIANGHLIAQGTLDELRHQAGKGGLTLEDTFLALVGQDAVAA